MSTDSRLQHTDNSKLIGLDGVTNELIAGQDELDRIRSLREPDDQILKPRKGGTSAMAPEKREAAAERMRRYWADRKRRTA